MIGQPALFLTYVTPSGLFVEPELGFNRWFDGELNEIGFAVGLAAIIR